MHVYIVWRFLPSGNRRIDKIFSEETEAYDYAGKKEKENDRYEHVIEPVILH